MQSSWTAISPLMIHHHHTGIEDTKRIMAKIVLCLLNGCKLHMSCNRKLRKPHALTLRIRNGRQEDIVIR